jgi:predicted NAD/FAD-dependent oxidoreductase
MKNIAIIGAGMAGVSAARTLLKAGHRVQIFEKSRGPSGRMSTRESSCGSFDHGVQYFTIRDPRFQKAITEVPGTSEICRPWSTNAVRVLDEHGRVIEAPLPAREQHFVAVPGMNALVKHWIKPLEELECVHYNTEALRLESVASKTNPSSAMSMTWTVHARVGDQVQQMQHFDQVILAVPNPQCKALIEHSVREKLIHSELSSSLMAIKNQIDLVVTEPCWTLMVGFPQASQPGLPHLGPQWNVAKSTHHRIAWLARESSKPGKSQIERWTVQAAPGWSSEHLEDDPERVKAKLLRAFSELTGIRAEPTHCVAHRWRYAKTKTPLGQPYLWTEDARVGTCGDWHLGHRVEDAFISGLSLALRLA